MIERAAALVISSRVVAAGGRGDAARLLADARAEIGMLRQETAGRGTRRIRGADLR